MARVTMIEQCPLFALLFVLQALEAPSPKGKKRAKGKANTKKAVKAVSVGVIRDVMEDVVL
jgi:hypothetical protein